MQNLQLLLHIPDQNHIDNATRVSWQLFDRQANLLREGEGLPPRGEHTVLVLPARRIVCIETALPAVSPTKRDALLRYAIEDKLTLDPATVHAVVVGPAGRGNNHVVAAIDRAWLTALLDWLAAAAITPTHAVSASALIPVAAGEWGIAIADGHGLARRADGFAYSFDVDTADAATPPFSLMLALKEAHDANAAPSRLSVFTSHGTDHRTDPAADSHWASAWADALHCPVRVAPRGRATPVNAQQGNFLTGDFAPQSAGRSWLTPLKPALIVAAVLAMLQLTFTLIDAWQLLRQRRAIEAEMVQVFKDAFPQATAIVDPALQMRRNVNALKRDAGLGASGDARQLLAELNYILKAVATLTPNSVAIGESGVSANVTVRDANATAALKDRVANTAGATLSEAAGNSLRITLSVDR